MHLQRAAPAGPPAALATLVAAARAKKGPNDKHTPAQNVHAVARVLPEAPATTRALVAATCATKGTDIPLFIYSNRKLLGRARNTPAPWLPSIHAATLIVPSRFTRVMRQRGRMQNAFSPAYAVRVRNSLSEVPKNPRCADESRGPRDRT